MGINRASKVITKSCSIWKCPPSPGLGGHYRELISRLTVRLPKRETTTTNPVTAPSLVRMENPSLDNTLAHEAGPGHDTYRVHIVNPNEVSVLIL